MLKGLVAGTVNLILALLAARTSRPPARSSPLASVGFLGYGVSLALFVLGLRHLGTARTGAYFSLAPFIGAVLAVAHAGRPASSRLLVAGGLMGLGLWLHLAERHDHDHAHEALAHEHRHLHDEHHQHAHGPDPPGSRTRTGTGTRPWGTGIRTIPICTTAMPTGTHPRRESPYHLCRTGWRG